MLLPTLSSVTGNEAMAVTYPEFYKWFVQRKKQELVNPRFIGIGEVSLPRFSLIHFWPKNPEEYGPATSEAFISNFTGDVFIQFDQNFEPVLGNGRTLAFEVRKAIQSYRGSHFTYNWTKDIATQYNKEKVLVVKNYGLIPHIYQPRASLFVNFETHYNRYHALMKSINVESGKGDRRQFLRVDLPIHMPSWSELLQDYDHYVKTFKDGKPVPNNQMVRVTKAESSYWLLDMLGFLFGDYKYSQFGSLTDKAMQDLHLIFVANSRCLVVHMATLKSWLEELNDVRFLERVAKEEEAEKKKAEDAKKVYVEKPVSLRTGLLKRLNVSKRVYLSFLNMTRDSVPEQEVVEEKHNAPGTVEETTKDSKVVAGSKRTAEKEQARNQGKDGKVLRQDEPKPAASNGNPLLDVFADRKTVDVGSVQAASEPGDGAVPEAVEDWTSEVDDSLLEQEQIVHEVSVDKDAFPTIESGIAAALEERAREGVLTVAEQQFFMRKGTQFKHIELENGQTLEEFIPIKQEELEALKDDAKIKGTFLAAEEIDLSVTRSRAMVLKQGYVNKFLLKDQIRMVLGIQNAGIAINDFKHEVVEGIEGSYDVFSIQAHPVDGEQGTYHIRMPRVQPDSTFTVDGVKSHMQLQRMERPIRKINKFKVALTSYYDRKLMISRSLKKVDDLGEWLVKQVVARGKGAEPLVFSRGSVFDASYKAPRLYSILSTKFQYIKAGEYTLDFRINKLLAEHPEWKVHTKQGDFLIGEHKGNPITIDDYGNLYVGGVEFNTLEGLMSINTSKAPTEYAVMNVGGYLFPMGVILCYYFGIDKLLKIVKATTRSVPMGTRPKLSEDEYAIAFNDEYLIFNRREKLATLIFGGMPRLNNISNFSRSNLNDKGVWVPLMGDKKVRPQQFAEMKLLFDMFIDPITKGELKRLGYSQSFHYLLIDAVKLLETDWSRHQVELEEQRIVGYERFAGHLYREWVKATRQYRSKGKGRKHKLDFNPEAVVMNIITDTSVNLVEEVGPIHQLKDQEEITFGGVGGQGEISVTKKSRMQLESYKGVISEAHKDSGKVGFVGYISSDANIVDYRGNIAIGEKPSYTSLMSVTGNLAFGMNRDDPKRGMFTSTQWSQAVSAMNYTPSITRTPYDNIIAQRTSELYSKVAKEDGKVSSVDADVLRVTYKDGTTDTYPMGLVIGEASGEIHRHTRVTDLSVGDSFKAGDVIGWDDLWFTRDIFNPGQAALKVGKTVRVCLLEDQDTYEDSIAISKEMAMEFVTPYLKPNKFQVDIKQIVNWKVKVGDEVDYDSILCEVEDDHLGGASDENTLVGDVNRLGIKQIRSNHHGKIVQIEVMYNGELDQMSDSLRKFVQAADKDRARKASFTGSPVKTGAVNASQSVKKPMLSPERCHVRILVESMDPSTTADKYVIGNQMKGTTGNIMSHILQTLDGRIVDVKASFKGMFNRMVLSLRDKLGCNELVYQVTKKAIKIYRGTK